MLRRVSNHCRGMKEKDLIRLVQALLISRVTYATPYITLTESCSETIDRLIRKAFKQVLNLPVLQQPVSYTSTIRYPSLLKATYQANGSV
ncbi:hypothetical protein HPB48_012438 [Haemaphysalis longicornis]|uniref:Tick transposon n=1 Tax=Haemaphysalis longicornis TaxID=44386 RepID=A0A9J6G1X7_HAELO|nr:hypothetical protein HPB48_012438 [Haemaphysalis longicornis]